LAEEPGDQGHEDIVGEGLDDRVEGQAQDDRHRQLHHVAAQGELLELVQHGQAPFR
jgi:hypothetical protein